MDAESLRKTIIAELYKRHPSLGARSIDEFADFVVGLYAAARAALPSGEGKK